MGFWLFGGSKRKRSSNLLEQAAQPTSEKNVEPTLMARSQPAGSRDPQKMSTPDPKNQSTERPSKLSNTPGAASRDLAPAMYSRRQATPVNTGSSSKRPAKTFLEHFSAAEPIYSSERGSVSTMYHQNPASRSSIGPENFSVVRTPPTLRRRNDQDQSLPRHISSKRKAEEHAREREVRAMSSPIPIPKRSPAQSQGLLRKETKMMPGDLNRHFERPKSEVSLPLPESFSEINERVDQHSFKVSAFAVLSPRPTIKYSGSSHFIPPRSTTQSRASTRQLIAEEDFTPKKRIDDLADNLDSGGLRELLERDKRRRERKREGEKAKLHRKLQRRAERQREDEQRRAQELDARPSTPEGKSRRLEERLELDTEMSSSPPLPEGMRETSSPLPITALERRTEDDPFADDTGAGPSGSPMEEDAEKAAPAPVVDPFSHPEDIPPESRGRPVADPFSDAEDTEAVFHGDPEELLRRRHEAEEPDLPVRSPLRTVKNQEPSTQAVLSPPTPPEHAPMERANFPPSTTEQREQTRDVPPSTDGGRRDSGPGAQTNTWAAFFKRGGRRKRSSTDRGRDTPSEFSNTSRESFSRQQPPPVMPPRSFRRSEPGTAATPQRTRSKFREDLPELPMSPPDSRLQSPELAPESRGQSPETTPAHHPKMGAPSGLKEATPSSAHPADGRSLATSSSIPTLDRSRQDDQLSSPRSFDFPTQDIPAAAAAAAAAPAATAAPAAPAAPPPPVLSQSLASVDSEGSWLSGKPVKRSSGPMGHPLRQSQSSLGPALAAASSEREENDVAEDEYFNRLTPAPEETRRSSHASAMRKASSTAIDLAGDGDQSPGPDVPPLPDQAGETWHRSVGRQAMIVRPASRAKSKEGLLNEFLADDSSSQEDETSPVDFEAPAEDLQESPVMRARSVEYGKGHARHISAGSARLLDIRRSSVQSEAVSMGEKSPTATRGMSAFRPDEGEKPAE